MASCDAEMSYSVSAEFRRSDIVAIVRATGVAWLDEHRRPTKLNPPLALGSIPGGLDPYLGAYYTVTVEHAFKGNPAHRFRIFSENTTARTPLLMGQSLLVFLRRAKLADEYQRPGDLTIDRCGNSALAAKVPARLMLVKRLGGQR